jgi:UDP-N-acetylglucosamine acyltransferase
LSNIHPTAVVEPGAQVADDATIGPMCCVGPDAVIGPGTRLVHRVTVMGRTTLGRDNVVWPNAVLGGDPQDLKFKGEQTQLIIGDHNEIREGATLHLGTDNGGGVTRVGDHNLIMVNAHVAHDCCIASHCVLANNLLLAGHVHIEDHVTIGGGTAVHHFITIGKYAYVGGATTVRQDAPPYMIFEGMPGRVRAVNTIGLQRNGFEPASVANLKQAYRVLFRDVEEDGQADPADDSTILQRLATVEAQYPGDAAIAYLGQFIRRMADGVYGRYRESLRQDNKFRNPAK